ncbi:MAG: FAD-dependent oxidoreductase [Kiritimatiellia bacterium]|nr:FAD-dependent oxidoreductase [Kiritimatiellia bacterium]MDP6630420.1 FAD-dependent oxidoreductase [Kiritimatiellia bacterium]MDP6809877.1 FAD-dependent oxidoreductase [Kiritimatiellia bacterium]MDP7024269.1 FAD-dependent oxidoreductase [Kiritimatiellia bacterium]
MSGPVGREQPFNVRIPNLSYWMENIPCQYACPVHTDARGYVRAIAAGDFESAYLIARGPNPLASVCGRICAAPCEMACRRGTIDTPIAIRALKRFVTSSYGAEATPPEALLHYLETKSAERLCEGRDELRNFLGQGGAPVTDSELPSVAIIGAGPAGLACAHDLALLGFRAVIYELEDRAAGMLYVGVPEYRLPRDLIRAEVASIEAMGVEIKCNTEVGRDVTLAALREQHAALVLAVGAKKSRALPVPGVEGPGVLSGIDFLRDVALGRSVTLGKKMVVIGGGSVSYDVARSAWRTAGPMEMEMVAPERTVAHMAYEDVTNVAARQTHGEVHLCCLESREQMLADPMDIREGEEEGIIRHNSVGPQEVLRDADGKVSGVRFAPVLSLFDAEGRFSPTFDMDNTHVVECDTVLVAIGQVCDLGFLSPESGVELDPRGYPTYDSDTLMTTAAGTFVAGDLQTGPRLVIDAIASGKKAARGVFTHLTGQAVTFEDTEAHFEIADYAREGGYETIRRAEIGTLDPGQRRDLKRVVEGRMEDSEACREGSRCLDCGVNTIFDGSKCILCGGCSEVCPELCLKLVSLSNLDMQNAELAEVLDRHHMADAADTGAAIIKDEARCIRCGLCAERCPVDAVTMERFSFQQRRTCHVE